MQKIKKDNQNIKFDKYLKGIFGFIFGLLFTFGLIYFLVIYNHLWEINSNKIDIATYKIDNTNIVIPNHSVYSDYCCDSAISFKTVIEYDKLVHSLKEIMRNFEEITCAEKKYYYNELEDYTILEYYVKDGFILNQFTLVYQVGRYSCQ